MTAPSALLVNITLPPFPLKADCTVCAIYRANPEVYTESLHMLLLGISKKEILLFLHTKGFQVSQRAFYRHCGSHVEPHLNEMLEIKSRAVAEHLAQILHVDGRLTNVQFAELQESNSKTSEGGRRWTPTSLLKNNGTAAKE